MGKSKKKKVAGQHTPGAGTRGPVKPFVSSATVLRLPNADISNERICWRFCHADSDGP